MQVDQILYLAPLHLLAVEMVGNFDKMVPALRAQMEVVAAADQW